MHTHPRFISVPATAISLAAVTLAEAAARTLPTQLLHAQARAAFQRAALEAALTAGAIIKVAQTRLHAVSHVAFPAISSVIVHLTQ